MLVVILKYGIIEILMVAKIVAVIIVMVIVEVAREEIRGEKFNQIVNQPPPLTNTTIAPLTNNTNQHNIPHKGIIPTL